MKTIKELFWRTGEQKLTLFDEEAKRAQTLTPIAQKRKSLIPRDQDEDGHEDVDARKGRNLDPKVQIVNLDNSKKNLIRARDDNYTRRIVRHLNKSQQRVEMIDFHSSQNELNIHRKPSLFDLDSKQDTKQISYGVLVESVRTLQYSKNMMNQVKRLQEENKELMVGNIKHGFLPKNQDQVELLIQKLFEVMSQNETLQKNTDELKGQKINLQSEIAELKGMLEEVCKERDKQRSELRIQENQLKKLVGKLEKSMLQN